MQSVKIFQAIHCENLWARPVESFVFCVCLIIESIIYTVWDVCVGKTRVTINVFRIHNKNIQMIKLLQFLQNEFSRVFSVKSLPAEEAVEFMARVALRDS